MLHYFQVRNQHTNNYIKEEKNEKEKPFVNFFSLMALKTIKYGELAIGRRQIQRDVRARD